MVTATYQTLIHRVGNGAFTGSSDDVTGKVIFMEWVRGRQFASQLTGKALGGVANIHLNNDGGTFSTQNNSSPLTGSLLPGRAIRIRSTAPSTTVLWEGKLDVLENRVSLDNAHVAVVKAIGPLALVQQRNVRVPMTTSTLTGVLINRILDDVNWPTGSRSIDAGQTTVTYYWTENKPALEALREVEDTEAGYIGESKDGKIVFEDRDHRLSGTHITSQATFTDNSTGTLFFFMVEIIASLGAVLTFPNLSKDTKAMSCCQDPATPNKNLKIIEIKYPIKTTTFLFPNLSENHPPRSLQKLENPSFKPLNNPMAIPPPPREIM